MPGGHPPPWQVLSMYTPLDEKLYVGANKMDRKYGRLDRNYKARSGSWIFFNQLIFVVKIFVAVFASMHFLRRGFFYRWKLRFSWIRKNSIRKNKFCDKCNFQNHPRISHVYVEKFGKDEAKCLDHQFEVPQNERGFLCLFLYQHRLCLEVAFPNKKRPKMSGTVRSNGGCKIWAYLVSPSIIYCKSSFFSTRMDGNHFGIVNGHRHHSNPPYLVFHSIGMVFRKTNVFWILWHGVIPQESLASMVHTLHGWNPEIFTSRCSFFSDTSTG